MKTLALLALLLVGCSLDGGEIEAERRAIHYELGKVVAIRAYYQLELRRIQTGIGFTNPELYRLADSLAGMGEFKR